MRIMDIRIKLATVAGKMKGGGVEQIVMEYMRQLDRDKFELSLIVDSYSTIVPEQELSDFGVKLIWAPPYQKIAAYHRVLYRLFCDEKFDIVHAHINTLNVFPLFAAWRAHVPVRIAHNHSTLGKGETKKNIAKYLLRPFANVFRQRSAPAAAMPDAGFTASTRVFLCCRTTLTFAKANFAFKTTSEQPCEKSWNCRIALSSVMLDALSQRRTISFL